MTQDTTRQERILERRAARTRRSKWLGRVLFSLTGMALLLALRMNPGVVEDVIAMTQGAEAHAQAQSQNTDAKADRRQMPRDVIPVRRGGALPQGTNANQDTQTQADAVANTLRGLAPGG